MRSLSAFLLERQRSGGSAVLIIDQAEQLSPDFLEGSGKFRAAQQGGAASQPRNSGSPFVRRRRGAGLGAP